MLDPIFLDAPVLSWRITGIREVWILFAFSSSALRVLAHPWTAAIPVAFSTPFGGGSLDLLEANHLYLRISS